MAFVALVPAIYINVKQYGASGNGSTDDTAAIQAAIAAATTGSVVFFPQGVYIVSATITYPGYVTLLGSGDSENGTIIRVKAGTSLTTPVLASADWNSNTATCGNPVRISDIQIDGNSATSGSAAHGLILYNFWSVVERVTIKNVAGDGLYFTAFSKNGTHISNTCNEAKLLRIQARNCSGVGIHVYDDGTTLNSCTDGFLKDCIVQNAGLQGILIEMGPGWLVQGNHVYGTGTDAIYVKRCFATRVHGNYVDGYGSGSNTYIGGVAMDCLDGRSSSCVGNVIAFESGAATGPYQALRINGSGSNTTIVFVSGNSVSGGSQSGSIGYVITTSVSQQSHPFYVYSRDNDIRFVATTYYSDGYAIGGDLQALGHLVSIQQNTTTAAAGANAGTSPPAPVLTTSNDLDGHITFGTGTGAAAGAQVVVTFANAYAHAPIVVVTPINSASASLNFYVTSATGTFTVSCVNAPTSSQGNTVYGFNYHVLA